MGSSKEIEVKRIWLWCAFMLSLSGCGAAADVAPRQATVCGSDTALGFVGIQGLVPSVESGARAFAPGAGVLSEIGYTYVAVSRSCAFWSYGYVGPRGTPGGVLYTGTLTADQVSDVDALLKLGSWTSLGEVHGIGGVFDYTPSSYHWGARTVAWLGAVGEGPPPLPEAFPLDLAQVHLQLRELLADFGTETTGPVRYTVVEPNFVGPETQFELAPSWPLSTAVADIAMSEDTVQQLETAGAPIPVHRADGHDADALRALRASARNGEFGSIDHLGFTPIKEADGREYMLYLRDVGVFESPEGVPERDPFAL